MKNEKNESTGVTEKVEVVETNEQEVDEAITSSMEMLDTMADGVGEAYQFKAEKPSDEEVAFGGVNVPVNGHDGVLLEVVKVKLVSRNLISILGTHWGNEWSEMQLYVDPSILEKYNKCDDWDDDSYTKVITEGRRLNFTRWEGWLMRQTNLNSVTIQNKHLKTLTAKAVRKELMKEAGQD